MDSSFLTRGRAFLNPIESRATRVRPSSADSRLRNRYTLRYALTIPLPAMRSVFIRIGGVGKVWRTFERVPVRRRARIQREKEAVDAPGCDS